MVDGGEEQCGVVPIESFNVRTILKLSLGPCHRLKLFDSLGARGTRGISSSCLNLNKLKIDLATTILFSWTKLKVLCSKGHP